MTRIKRFQRGLGASDTEILTRRRHRTHHKYIRRYNIICIYFNSTTNNFKPLTIKYTTHNLVQVPAASVSTSTIFKLNRLSIGSRKF